MQQQVPLVFQWAGLAIQVLAVVVLVPYVIATIKIARRATEQLKLLKEDSKRGQNEFTARTRPYLGFQNLRKDDGKWWYTLRNFGWNPATLVRVKWATGETDEALISRGAIPKGEDSKIVIFPQQDRSYELTLGNYEKQFGTSTRYIGVQVTYSSPFGSHWTSHLLLWVQERNQWTLDKMEIGDGEPLKLWSDLKTEGSYGSPGVRISDGIAPATPAPNIIPPGTTNSPFSI